MISLGNDPVQISNYMDKLQDPEDGGDLQLTEDGRLIGTTSGLTYGWQGDFPDLRPGSGQSEKEISKDDGFFPGAVHARVRDHYDDKPCYNYIALDNVPLGRYLREPDYDKFFENADFVVEVGSGRGAIAQAFKENRNITPFCVDLAYGSLRHTRNEPIHADGVLGSNLKLPLKDNVADLVVSYGVIHHTPDPTRCFMELSRIVKPGGYLLLNVYNWENLYRSLYFFFSPPLKAVLHVAGDRVGNAILKFTAFPFFYIVLWAVLGLKQGNWRFPSVKECYEQFADFFLTPIARFYHSAELHSLGEACGMTTLEQDTGGWPQDGFAHFVWYQKK